MTVRRNLELLEFDIIDEQVGGHGFARLEVRRYGKADAVDDGEARVYRAGEHWTEQPGARHGVSENASDTEPAKLLAILVADTRETDLVTYDKK